MSWLEKLLPTKIQRSDPADRRSEGGGQGAVKQHPAHPRRQQLAAAEAASGPSRQNDGFELARPCRQPLFLSMLSST